MARLTSIAELRALRSMLQHDRAGDRPCIVVCGGTACRASGSERIILAAQRHILERGLHGRLGLRITGCHGFCEMGPFVLTEPQGAFYAQVADDDVPRIIDAVLAGEYVEELLYRDPVTGKVYRSRDDIPFFKNQQRRILALNQQIDPTRIYDYVAQDGYQALEEVLSRRDPAWVVAQVKDSGLRGRGGAGFPTGVKWERLARQPNGRGKFVVCNADEGDPGAYMDRSVLEGNPHSIIEGMLIGAYGTGANRGVVYVRKEYPLAVRHLSVALRQARDHGLLGDDVLGSGLSFDIDLVQGAGAFVCGEETALIRSIEGKMGEPRQRPPFPVEKGIDGKPTAINNVETWANIPLVFRLGAEAFAQVGTKGNTGTKIFSLVGKIKNTGLVEVPMGTRIRDIVYEIGGGPAGKASIKAVQTGGPSGGCIPAERFDLPIDYDSLTRAGSIMGSGGMIVMDENTCMVDVAKYFMGFLKDESCGKCLVCRKGTQRMWEILDDIATGRGTLEQLDLLEELAHVVKDASMCGLGQTAANPVLSTLRYFRHEYERHIVDKRCDAFVCRELTGAPCQAACPLGTEAWRYVALIEKGDYEAAYRVLREANPLPSICGRVCDRQCEQHCRLAASGGEAVAVRALKRFVTDRVDPAVYTPPRAPRPAAGSPRVAVVGAGPAGLAAAHYLSLGGHDVTLYEAEAEPGGMLVSCIPGYRLPRSVLRREIAALLDDGITLRCGAALGRDFAIDDLFAEGCQAVFLAMGAHKSWTLDLAGEGLGGVHPSMEFLKAFNLRGEELAGGHVGIIGGGNSAVDAARVAIRQEQVQSVTLLYRRTAHEMPAFEEEVEAAIEEGITLHTLVSPVRIRYIGAAVEEGVKLETMVSPVRLYSKEGRLVGIECIRNKLGEVDASGRRRPVPIPGTEFTIPLHTLIVAIGERPDSECLGPMGLELDKGGRPKVEPHTLATTRPGVFAGGDLVTGPRTVVEAIAAGRKAAGVVGRYLRGEQLRQPPQVHLPSVFVPPADVADDERDQATRAAPTTRPSEARAKNFAEVEETLSPEEAHREARRCLRCDLQFTQREGDDDAPAAAQEEQA